MIVGGIPFRAIANDIRDAIWIRTRLDYGGSMQAFEMGFDM